MIELRGKYNTAKVFTDNIDETTISQVIELLNQDSVKNSKIRIMPDTHAGAGCTIGTTMTIEDKIVPNLVGVDIGCGMAVANIGKCEIDYAKLDEVIKKYIPSGMEVHKKSYNFDRLKELICFDKINKERARKSIGTLGGGNHYIEIDVDDNEVKYLVVHSGSRYLGKQVAELYQKIGYNSLIKFVVNKEEIIKNLKSEGRQQDIQKEISEIKPKYINKDLAYVYKNDFSNYIHDMKIVQQYATLNRNTMIDIIVRHMNFNIEDRFTTIHNYIDTETMILRKGAISAQYGERVIIPMNMRDGSLICIGKGNPDWNYSAPHGAGRIMSRSKAKNNISFDEFQKSMKDVWTSSVCQSTIDESPMVYKPMEEIINNISDTVNIIKIVKPAYNFKAH